MENKQNSDEIQFHFRMLTFKVRSYMRSKREAPDASFEFPDEIQKHKEMLSAIHQKIVIIEKEKKTTAEYLDSLLTVQDKEGLNQINKTLDNHLNQPESSTNTQKLDGTHSGNQGQPITIDSTALANVEQKSIWQVKSEVIETELEEHLQKRFKNPVKAFFKSVAAAFNSIYSASFGISALAGIIGRICSSRPKSTTASTQAVSEIKEAEETKESDSQKKM